MRWTTSTPNGTANHLPSSGTAAFTEGSAPSRHSGNTPSNYKWCRSATASHSPLSPGPSPSTPPNPPTPSATRSPNRSSTTSAGGPPFCEQHAPPQHESRHGRRIKQPRSSNQSKPELPPPYDAVRHSPASTTKSQSGISSRP